MLLNICFKHWIDVIYASIVPPVCTVYVDFNLLQNQNIFFEILVTPLKFQIIYKMFNFIFIYMNVFQWWPSIFSLLK